MRPAHGYAILLVYTPTVKDVIRISITSASLPAKKRILTVCVRLFLEKGYRRTTLAEIIEKAEVSYSTFQNIFRAVKKTMLRRLGKNEEAELVR